MHLEYVDPLLEGAKSFKKCQIFKSLKDVRIRWQQLLGLRTMELSADKEKQEMPSNRIDIFISELDFYTLSFSSLGALFRIFMGCLQHPVKPPPSSSLISNAQVSRSTPNLHETIPSTSSSPSSSSLPSSSSRPEVSASSSEGWFSWLGSQSPSSSSSSSSPSSSRSDGQEAKTLINVDLSISLVAKHFQLPLSVDLPDGSQDNPLTLLLDCESFAYELVYRSAGSRRKGPESENERIDPRGHKIHRLGLKRFAVHFSRQHDFRRYLIPLLTARPPTSQITAADVVLPFSYFDTSTETSSLQPNKLLAPSKSRSKAKWKTYTAFYILFSRKDERPTKAILHCHFPSVVADLSTISDIWNDFHRVTWFEPEDVQSSPKSFRPEQQQQQQQQQEKQEPRKRRSSTWIIQLSLSTKRVSLPAIGNHVFSIHPLFPLTIETTQQHDEKSHLYKLSCNGMFVSKQLLTLDPIASSTKPSENLSGVFQVLSELTTSRNPSVYHMENTISSFDWKSPLSDLILLSQHLGISLPISKDLSDGVKVLCDFPSLSTQITYSHKRLLEIALATSSEGFSFSAVDSLRPFLGLSCPPSKYVPFSDLLSLFSHCCVFDPGSIRHSHLSLGLFATGRRIAV